MIAGTEEGAALRAQAEAIFRAGLARVDPLAMMDRVLTLDGDRLTVKANGLTASYDLSRYRRILVLGAGKASARMGLGLERLLGGRIADGFIVVKDGGLEALSRIETAEASHPEPDARSEAAARRILALAQAAGPEDLVVALISGGASSLMAAPRELPGHPLTLADKQAVTRLLLACGAPIQDINAVRKRLSAVKGGRLARAIAPAACLSLILSDVTGDDVGVIGSGPTARNAASAADALTVLARYGLADEVPAAKGLLQAECAMDRADGVFPDKVANLVIGSNRLCLTAAAQKALELGWNPLILTSRLTGEAREMGGLMLSLCLDCAENGLPLAAPACILAGGETTVTLRGTGLGGRNQEMALAYLAGLDRMDAASLSPGARRAVYLQAGTDGDDGPTGAAGAFAGLDILLRARKLGLDPARFLAGNDSNAFFKAVDGLLVTGPTRTNVCDAGVLLIPGAE